jgi:galactokinase
MTWLDPGDPDTCAASAVAALAAPATAPVLVTRAPGRVNLIGEHTDYNGGLCLPLALPHATYAAATRRDGGRVRIVSAQADDAWEGTAADGRRASGWAAYAAGVVWALAEAGIDVPGLDLALDGTVPLGAGLSSSAAVECAVATAVAGLAGRGLDGDDRALLVRACMRAEQEVAGAPTGGMDQTVSLFARAGHALLVDFDLGQHRPVPLRLEQSGLALLVVDTRVAHALVDGGYGARRADCEDAAHRLGLEHLGRATRADLARLGDDRVHRRARHVVTENARVRATVDALAEDDWETVGAAMDASHASLRDDFEVSCAELDTVVAAAREAGALGARMTGGGFGGSAVALVRADDVDRVHGTVRSAAHVAGHPDPSFLAVTAAAGAEVLRHDGAESA